MSFTDSSRQGSTDLFGNAAENTRGKPSPVAAPKPPSVQTPAHAHYVLQTLAEWFYEGDHRKAERMALRFMRDHAGVVLAMPTLSAIERLAMERNIVESLDRDPSLGTVARLATFHGQPNRTVSKVFKRIRGEGLAARRARDTQHCRHPRLSRRAVRV